MVGEDPRLSATKEVPSAEGPAALTGTIPRGSATTSPPSGPTSTTEYFAPPTTGTDTATPPEVAPSASTSGHRRAGADGLRRWWARRDRSFLLWGVASYAVVLGVLLALSLRASDGHLVYVLDDPAIHRSVAANLVDHGTWGVDAGHFQSASSSPLWTLLLGAYLLASPLASAGPLLLNAVASVAVIAVLGANQSVLAPTRRRLGDAAGVAVLVTIVLFLPGLTLVGMEHVAHMALVLATVVLFHRQGLGELGRWPRWLPYVLLALATLARLETVFLAAGLGLALLSRCRLGWGPGGRAAARRTQLVRVALVGAATVLPLAVVAAANRLGGQAWLPNSVMAKSQVDDPLTPVYRLPVERLTADPLVAALTVALLVALALAWRRPARFAFPAIVAVVTAAGHMALARIGWYERYQAYLIVLAVYAGLQLAADVLAWRWEASRSPAWAWAPAAVAVSARPAAVAAASGSAAVAAPEPVPAPTTVATAAAAGASGSAAAGAVAPEPGRRWARARPAIGGLLVLALLPFCGTKLFLTVDAPLAVADTYEQRYQAGRFLAQYYAGEPVATGELGYVSVMHEGPITDLFGLGDYEVLQERMRNPHPDAAYWTGLAERRGFEVVAVYPSTIGAETPPEWLLAGWWTLPRRTVTAFEPRFEFWATTPEALFRLQDDLRAFTADMPDGVEVTINDPAAVEATQMAAAALAVTPEG
jgi:hypothetical protein